MYVATSQASVHCVAYQFFQRAGVQSSHEAQCSKVGKCQAMMKGTHQPQTDPDPDLTLTLTVTLPLTLTVDR